MRRIAAGSVRSTGALDLDCVLLGGAPPKEPRAKAGVDGLQLARLTPIPWPTLRKTFS